MVRSFSYPTISTLLAGTLAVAALMLTPMSLVAQGGGNVNTVWLVNKTDNIVYYQIRATGGAYISCQLAPGAETRHSNSSLPGTFEIRYDADYQPGFQEQLYTLDPTRHYNFARDANDVNRLALLSE